MNEENKQRALGVYKKSIVIDGLQAFQNAYRLEGRYSDDIAASGITAVHYTVPWLDDDLLPALRRISICHDFLEKHQDKYQLVLTAQDIEKVKREAKIGLIMGSQNARMIGDDLRLLRIFKELGVRIIQPCYYKQNFIGQGSGERTNGGLSNFGVEFVEEMNRLRLLIDVSHCKDQVTDDCLRFSKQPIIISHSNPRGMLNHHRNKTDEQIKSVAEKGGVIGITSYSPFCQLRKGVRPTIEDYLDLVDYTVKLVGIDFVCFGSDSAIETREEYEESIIGLKGIGASYFDKNIFTDKDGYDNPRHIPEIAEGLATRGYSDDDIEKFLGLNFMRVFREVWGK